MLINYAKLHEVSQAADKALARGVSFETQWDMYMDGAQRALFADRDEFVRLSRAQMQRVTR